MAWRGRRARALADGWLAGTVFYLVLLRWLDHTFLHFSAIPWPITWLPIAALAAYCGLYVALTAAAVAWLRNRIGAAAALGLVPALWVAGEWLRGHLLDGFPWGLLGYSQHAVLPVIQIAELAGVYGVSFLIALVNAALAALIGLGWRRASPSSPSPACCSWPRSASDGPRFRRQDRATGGVVQVGLIQPSIEQTLKWDPAYHARILDTYEALTREAARSRPAVILWPETADDHFPPGRSRAARQAHRAVRASSARRS